MVIRDRQTLARATAVAILAAAVMLAGCSAAARLKPGKPGSVPNASEIGRNVAQNAGQMPWAPKELLDMESQAESLVNAALAGEWAKVDANFARVKADWPAVRREVARRHVDESLLKRVDRVVEKTGEAAAKRDAEAAAGNANALTGYGAAFMNLFQMTTPPQIPMMDFQARAAMLDARAGEWRAVEAEVGALDGIWLSFHPIANAKRPDNHGEIERRLAAISRDAEAKDAAAVARDAQALIKEVDTLRTQFMRGK
ncbi:MAG: hypothetical protein IRZ18_00555 [Clostridia bacterium]|nr:hypothetical protein [Clostridia bacterium]